MNNLHARHLMIMKLFKRKFIFIPIYAAPIVISIFTLGKYYGFYYDNHYFNLLTLNLLEKFKFYFYLGSHYSIHSTFYSYFLYPFFIIFGPTDTTLELVSVIFHLLTIFICFKLGKRFYGQNLGLIFSALVAVAPIHFINFYTWPELSFVIFLNILSIYYFLTGFQELSKAKLIISALLYSLSCFQKIYSALLFLFFIIYALLQVIIYKNKPKIFNPLREPGKKNKFLSFVFYGLITIAYLYFIFLFEAMFVTHYRIFYYLLIVLFLLFILLRVNKLKETTKRILRFSFLPILIITTVLLLLDLFIQLDINLFKQKFGYYSDTTHAGGFGFGRPVFNFNKKEIEVFKSKIHLSVLSSPLVFSSIYTRSSFNLSKIWNLFLSYHQKCFPAVINIFLILGIIGFLSDILIKKIKNYNLNEVNMFPLAWLLAALLSFVNANPYHIMRVYILPMPYFFASLGIYYLAEVISFLSRIGIKNYKTVSASAIIILVSAIDLTQFNFLTKNIYNKYRSDNVHSNYYELFHGWPYGRNYKEVGEFLLKDAPLKRDGKFRSIFIYTISPDTSQGICALFFNTIDWYTQNKIKIIYDVKDSSNSKYGSRLSLAQYLNRLFSSDHNIEAIYFADFYDTKDNFSFFSKVHSDIKPYKIVNNDESLEYDCVLYKFEKNKWKEQIGWEGIEIEKLEQELFQRLVLKKNLLMNNDFSTWQTGQMLPSGWLIEGKGELELLTDITLKFSGNNSFIFQDIAELKDARGKNITLACWLKTDSLNAVVEYSNRAGRDIRTDFHPSDRKWHLMMLNTKTPNDAKIVEFRIRLDSPGVVYIKNPILVVDDKEGEGNENFAN